MGKKRVLEVAFPALNNSGVPAVIMGIVRELHNDIDFDVLVFRREVGHHEKEFLSYGGRIHHIDFDRKKSRVRNLCEKLVRPWRLYYETKRILKEGHYDAIHCHNGFDSCWCLLAAKKEGIPVRVAHSHASVNPFEKKRAVVSVYEGISRWIICRYSTDRVGCSQIAADRLFGDNHSTEIIVNAVDLSRFCRDHYPKKQFDKKKPSFVFIGRLTEQKNPQFIIRLFKAILDDIPNASLTIVGFGPLEDLVNRSIIEAGIEDHVAMLPHSSDVPQILATSDFFLMPSYFEGLPVVLVEAQAMGVYAFISDTVAQEANLGLCEYITICGGIETWKQRIVSVINGPELKTIPDSDTLKNYSWSTISGKYKRIYMRN